MVTMEKQLSMTLDVLKTCMFVETTVGKSVMVYVSRWLMKVSVEEGNYQWTTSFVQQGEKTLTRDP